MVKKRLLLKLSGEVLAHGGHDLYDHDFCRKLAKVLVKLHKKYELAIVFGGGNIVRGKSLAGASEIDVATSHYLGMLGTVMNALYLSEMIKAVGGKSRVYSALSLPDVVDLYTLRAARVAVKTDIILLAGGTGRPFFTTDSAAALRATELGCHLMLKGTKVDGVYDCDPVKHKNAKLYKKLSYAEAMEKRLGVMDQTAFALLSTQKIPVKIFNMTKLENIERAVEDQKFGTIVF